LPLLLFFDTSTFLKILEIIRTFDLDKKTQL
jgi:chemotaxis protein CheC